MAILDSIPTNRRLLFIAACVCLSVFVLAPSAWAGWTAPSFLSPAGADAFEAQVDVSNDGLTTRRMWRGWDGSNWRIANGSACEGPCWVSPAGRDAFGSVLAAGNTRDAIAWSAYDATNSRIWLWVEGCGAKKVSVAGRDAYDPDVAVNDAGDVAAVWHRSNGTNHVIQLARVPAGSCAPSSPVNLSASGQDAVYPQVAVDSAATAMAAWLRFDGTKWRAQARAAMPSTLGAVKTLSRATGDALDPRVALAPDGTALLLWLWNDGANYRAQVRSRSPGDVLGTTQTLSAAGQDARNPELAMTPDGDAVAVWTRWDGANDRIQARARSAAGVLGATNTLSPTGSNADNADVGIDDDGNALLAWKQVDGVDSFVKARTRSAAGLLGKLQGVSAASADQVDLAVTGAGDARAVWLRSDGVDFRAEISSYHNAVPTDVTLSNASIPENEPPGSLVGELATADGENDQGYVYTLVPGTGSSGNSAFVISGNELRSAMSFDFEIQSSYSIRVRSTDDGLPQRFVEKVLTITVTDVSEGAARSG